MSIFWNCSKPFIYIYIYYFITNTGTSFWPLIFLTAHKRCLNHWKLTVLSAITKYSNWSKVNTLKILEINTLWPPKDPLPISPKQQTFHCYSVADKPRRSSIVPFSDSVLKNLNTKDFFNFKLIEHKLIPNNYGKMAYMFQNLVRHFSARNFMDQIIYFYASPFSKSRELQH